MNINAKNVKCNANMIQWHNIKQGSRKYQTSPALCNPAAPFATDRLHRRRPEIFRMLFALAGILNDLFCCMR